jgi:hypothetical protein
MNPMQSMQGMQGMPGMHLAAMGGMGMPAGDRLHGSGACLLLPTGPVGRPPRPRRQDVLKAVPHAGMTSMPGMAHMGLPAMMGLGGEYSAAAQQCAA